MKRFCLILIIQFVLLVGAFGQVIPKGMNYQAVARDLKGEIISKQKIALKIFLFDNADNLRTNHFIETHEVTTNEMGLFNLIVGEGVKEKGEFGIIPWNSENIWMEVAIKDKGQEFVTVSNSKLMAVPYAIYAGTAEELAKSNPTQKSSSPPEPGIISNSWSIFGNAKTNEAGNPYHINALGTTDKIDLILITDNIERMRILSGGDIITKLNFDIGKDLKVNQNLLVKKTAVINDSLIAKKNVILNNVQAGGTVNYGPFTVANMNPTYLTGRLIVDKAVDLDSTLNVDGGTNLEGRLFVNNKKATLLTGTLEVDSMTNLNDALYVNNISPTFLSGKMRVDSVATFKDKVKITSAFQTDTAGSAPSGSLQVGGGAYIKKNFFIGGIAKFGGPVVFGGVVAIGDLTQSTSESTGALKVSGGVGIGLQLNVGGMTMIRGMTTVKDLTESISDSTGALKVFGGVGIKKRANVLGAAVFGKSVNVSGITTVNNAFTVSNGGNFIAHFKNLNTNPSAGQNGISIQVMNPAPGNSNNFIEFRNSAAAKVGRIKGENVNEFLTNPKYIIDLEVLQATVELSGLAVFTASLDLASAVAGLIAAATSTSVCAGLGVCVTTPIISFIIQSALDVAAKTISLASVSLGLQAAQARESDFVNYKASRYGVSYESGSGDYAEWLTKSDPDEIFLPGQIVGLKNGQISKKTAQPDKYLVISTKPIVLGNMPIKDNENKYEKVAFMGQVPVYVLGQVNIGDYILPSGEQNGIGKAIAPDLIRAEDYASIVGVAWSASHDSTNSLINVAVGLNDRDVSKVMVEQKKMIQTLKSEFSKSDEILASLLPKYKSSGKSISAMNFTQPAISFSNFSASGNALGSMIPKPGTSDYREMSRDQVLKMLDLAEKTLAQSGVNTEGQEFWINLKTNSAYKENLIKDVQVAYKNEIDAQIEKWRPH